MLSLSQHLNEILKQVQNDSGRQNGAYHLAIAETYITPRP